MPPLPPCLGKAIADSGFPLSPDCERSHEGNKDQLSPLISAQLLLHERLVPGMVRIIVKTSWDFMLWLLPKGDRKKRFSAMIYESHRPCKKQCNFLVFV